MKKKSIALEPVKRAYPLKPISEFVESLDSHCIYDHMALAKAFKQECGFNATWPMATIAEVRKEIKRRGCGGYVDKTSRSRLTVSGVDVAVWAAKTFAIMSDISILDRLSGRGSLYREALKILKEARI